MDTDIDVLTATAEGLQQLLTSSTDVTSKDLVKIYLSQIKRHNDYLKAVISTAPESLLLERAGMLDEERKNGKLRGPLHGIPILIKDNIATHYQSTGLDTTAGSLALVNSNPRINAPVVDRLLEAGLIVIGKASLSELSWWKGKNLICGWNAVSGQAQSPYVKGGIHPDDSYAGHSNPGGSSSGSAIAVAAGFAPVSIGTETFGSLMLPAGRAALYSIKPGRSLISITGIVPISSFSDQPGPMTKTTKDLAMLMDIITDPGNVPPGGYASRVTGSWDGLKIGTVDPETWRYPPDIRKILDEGMEKQLIDQVRYAYEVIKEHATVFKDNIFLDFFETFFVDGKEILLKIFENGFKEEFEDYIKLLDTPQIKTLGELIAFNKAHADKELPAGYDNQDILELSEKTNVTSEDRASYISHLTRFGRDQGVNKIFEEFGLNIIMGPIESPLYYWAAASGYPVAAMPLDYLDYNGRPHGLCAVAKEEGLLIQLQSAYESTFAPRKPPTL
ncbi:amidase signature domain-containing protein [Trichoderma evansii]